jgi:hypothetical protein
MTCLFVSCGAGYFRPADASRRAAELNATVPYELGVEADPRLRVRAAFNELIETI